MIAQGTIEDVIFSRQVILFYNNILVVFCEKQKFPLPYHSFPSSRSPNKAYSLELLRKETLLMSFLVIKWTAYTFILRQKEMLKVGKMLWVRRGRIE